jgi:hypothetical protein
MTGLLAALVALTVSEQTLFSTAIKGILHSQNLNLF